MLQPIARPIATPAARRIAQPSGGSAPPEPVVPATWDADSKSALISLNGAALIAAATSNESWQSVRGNTGRTSGKATVQIQFPGSGDATLQVVGICTASAGMTGQFIGYDEHGWGLFAADGGKWNNLSSSAFSVPWSTEIISIEADFSAKLANVFAGNSLLGILDFSSLTGPYYFGGSLFLVNRTAVVNAGQSPYSRTPTAGYPAYWGPDD